MMKKIFIIFIVLVACIPLAPAQDQDLKHISLNSEREELQRYFGYENLISSYVTLPIDISLNTNERGYFVDIGFLVLILLPILFLWQERVRKSMISKFLVFFFLLVQLIYISTGYIFAPELKVRKITNGNYSNYTEINNSSFEDILAQFYIIGNKIIEPVDLLVGKLSGSTDYITYPFLCILFILLFWLNNKVVTNKLSKVTGLFLLTFSFFWLILSSGISWYGYLALAMSILVVIKLRSVDNRYLRFYSGSIISLWIIIAIVARISFITGVPQSTDSIAKYVIIPQFFYRSLGLTPTRNAVENVHPGLQAFAQVINTGNENDLIYTIGTSLDYFFNQNQQRIFKDNQLRMFNVIYERYKTKDKINQALELADFKYIIIDLNTPTLDRTPERTLTTKYNRLLEYVRQNTKLTLIGTDRKIRDLANQNIRYGVFGDEVVQRGTYAAYKIN